ncbi:hypothetical protein EG68_02598 [Paragonimus skrjabini miyazakii]|uniref:Uncharacterized protein n=1 Tax=Paragonimus skrjabini miyazakii TaxID=59628 RepID=A0A8S9Z8S0_9TREM|nr:hypothetical protein EG68_02598 [Paragonimus skrjabini miyazakii]
MHVNIRSNCYVHQTRTCGNTNSARNVCDANGSVQLAGVPIVTIENQCQVDCPVIICTSNRFPLENMTERFWRLVISLLSLL